jgi:quercetin dioxygenase-like cupin family protein
VNKPIVTFLVSCAALMTIAGRGHAKKAAAVFVPAAEAKWSDVPDFRGVQIAVVEGDPAKGPAHFFLKFAPGFVAPKHHHTADHHATVVTGSLIVTVNEGPRLLTPGSYFSFTGKTPHATRCDTGSSCIVFIDARGKWDVIPEKAPGPGGRTAGEKP